MSLLIYIPLLTFATEHNPPRRRVGTYVTEFAPLASNFGERKRLHISETLHLPTVGVSLLIGNRVIGRRGAGDV